MRIKWDNYAKPSVQCLGYSKHSINDNSMTKHVLALSSPLFAVLLSTVSVIRDQPWSENIKWEIPVIKNSEVLNCALF